MAWGAFITKPGNVVIDVTDRILEVRGSEKLGAESNSFRVVCKGIQEIHKFHKIEVRKDGEPRFAGFIINQIEMDAGYKRTEFECLDWTYILSNRVVAKSYEQTDSFAGKPDAIIKDILTSNVPELTRINIDPVNFTIESVQFPYVSAMEAVAKVMDFIPDWFWYIDPDKDFHLFNRYESDGVAFAEGAEGYNFLRNSLSVQYTGEKQVNKLWIIGAKTASSQYKEVFFEANGIQRVFGPLPYEPNFTEIFVNGVEKKSRLESNDDGASDFLINKTQKIIIIPDNITTPFSGTIKVKFRPTLQVVDYYENSQSVNEIGLYEKAVKNRDITDRMAARQYGKAEIKRKATERRKISLRTFEDVKIGQRCSVNIVEESTTHGNWNVVGSFLVTAVETSVSISESFTGETRTVEMEEIV